MEASDPDDVNASLFARRVKSYGGPSSASSSSRDQQPDWLKHRSAVVGGGSSSAGSSHTPYGAQVKTANKVGITSAHPTAQLMFSNSTLPFSFHITSSLVLEVGLLTLLWLSRFSGPKEEDCRSSSRCLVICFCFVQIVLKKSIRIKLQNVVCLRRVNAFRNEVGKEVSTYSHRYFSLE